MRITEADLEKLNESKDLAVSYVRKEKSIYQLQNVLNQINRYNKLIFYKGLKRTKK